MDKSALTGIVLLESYWASRKKDMLDLITPFIQYAVAKSTLLRSPVDKEKVMSIVREEFGYKDLPSSIVVSVLRRDREHFAKRKNTYCYEKDLSDVSERLKNREHDCREKIEKIGESLHNYLLLHCKKIVPENVQKTIEFLQTFFKSFAIPVELNNLALEEMSSKNDEVNYFISEFILECKEKNKSEYDIVVELTKGFLLQSAIYMQGSNSDIAKARYKGTEFYYDTPILLRLLKCDTEEKNNAAIELHDILRSQGAEFYYFEQNDAELFRILTAYQHSLVSKSLNTSSRTLEGLDRRNYKFDDVGRLKSTFARLLENKGIHCRAMPGFAVTDSDAIDVAKVDISENDAREYVRQHTKHYSEENLESDVSSALGIHRIRNGRTSMEIETCGAIFVTTNIDFTRAFNSFYRDSISINMVMPIITSFDLSAITWIKDGKIDSNIPEQQLLMNAYAALEPAPEVFERIGETLNKMVSEGEISEEEAIILRADRVAQKEFWRENIVEGKSNYVDESFITNYKEKYIGKIVDETKTSLHEEYRESAEKEKNDRIERARKKAREVAEKARVGYIKKWERIMYPVFAIVFVVCVIATVFSFEGSCYILGAIFLIFALVNVVSLGFTMKSTEVLWRKWIDKKATQLSDRVFEEKKDEYTKIMN